MEATSPKLTLTILRKYYPSVTRLDTFLSDVINITSPVHEKFRVIHEDDSQEFIELLQSTYVGSSPLKRTSFVAKQPQLNIREVIVKAQERLFREKRTPNILTLGYRYNWNQDARRPPIISYFLNTIVTIFEQRRWTHLLMRIGEDAMMDLLSETSLFLGLPNGCFCQITGDSILYATQISNRVDHRPLNDEMTARGGKRPLAAVVGLENGPRKRPKLDGVAQRPLVLGDIKRVTPVDITFARVRLLYSRPNVIPNSRTILVGLPLRHVLNRMYPSFSMDPPTVPSPEKDAKDVRHLAKYIFSRQYGFSNPFVGEHGKSTFRMHDYLDKELEIVKSGPRKTPQRLKDVLPLLSKLLRRHRRCRYALVLDRACPSKVKHKTQGNMDSSVILELLSETSVNIKTQKSGGNSSVGSACMSMQEKAKPRFIEFSCSHYEVYRYVVHVTNQVIPKSFWGSEKNLKTVFKYLREFISSRRHETLNLHHLLQGISTLDCDWLCPPGGRANKQTRISVTDAVKRRQLLEEFMFWYFDSFVMALLKTTFYITPSSALKNHILYFRHDDWSTLCAPLVERLTSKTFHKLSEAEANELLRRRKLGFSFVRLLPKETGVRPIVNLRRKKQMNYGKEASINQVLQTAFSILSYEKINQKELLGASIFGFDDIYNRLKQFKARLPRDTTGKLPKLYFVKVDVQACFDTIDQAKLISIIRNIISEDTYVTQRYGQVTISQDKVRRLYSKKAFPEDDQPHFLHHATELANFLRNTIFVDQVVYHPAQKQEILQLLEEHITDNIVKIGKDYYRQMIGIPQGSVLSSILCSFFYGDLEKGFSIFSEGPENVMLRLIDDYLYITTDPRKAHAFLEKMHKGHPEYGCFISDDKTLTNFNHKTLVVNVVDPSEKTFPWCGLSINMQDLSITVDYTRYRGSGIRNTLTVDKGRASGKAFTFKMLMLAKAKNHNLFTDSELNTDYVVYLNAYQNLLMTALKMCEYIHDWRVRKSINNKFLRNVIKQVILYSFTAMRRQARKKGLTLGDSDTGIRKEAVIWLGYQAFHHVLSKKQTKYRDIVRWLSVEIKKSNRRNHRYTRQFQTLMKSGQARIAAIMDE